MFVYVTTKYDFK